VFDDDDDDCCNDDIGSSDRFSMAAAVSCVDLDDGRACDSSCTLAKAASDASRRATSWLSRGRSCVHLL